MRKFVFLNQAWSLIGLVVVLIAAGLSGNTGYSIAPHLHFSMKVNDCSIDPLRFIDIMKKEVIN